MKRLLLVLLVLLVLLFPLSFVKSDNYENSSLKVSVSVFEPYALVDINPTYIDLGQTTKGYQTEYKNITVKNEGTLDVKIRPMLYNNADSIFQYLKFASASCSSWTNISKWTSAIIDKASSIGNNDGEEYHFCMKLDLKDYQEEIDSKKTNLTTDIIFFVMPA